VRSEDERESRIQNKDEGEGRSVGGMFTVYKALGPRKIFTVYGLQGPKPKKDKIFVEQII
jgi:hypothetical protein